MMTERLQLRGTEWARYFAPTTICAFLAALCIVLVVTSAFLRNLQDAVAVTAAGLFGLLLSGGLGVVFWRAQRRDLCYVRVATQADAATNHAIVRSVALADGWHILREEPARRIEAQTPGALLIAGERVAVEFRGSDVLIASICDPEVGFSLTGRRHCAQHRARLRQALRAPGPHAT